VTSENAGHIKQLDGLRGIAILFVLSFHFFDYGFLHPYLSFGWAGVDLFFVLSGFLITGILLDTKSNKGFYKTFLIRRALRILPLYYAVLLVFAFLSPHFSTTNWFEDYQIYFWTHTSNYLFLTKGFFRPLGHFWSLAIEEQFYLLWPLIIWIFRPGQLVIVPILFIIVGIFIRFVFSNPILTFGNPLAHVDGLLFGGIAAILIRRKRSLVARYTDPAFFTSLVLLTVYILVCWWNFRIREMAIFMTLPFTLTAISFAFVMFLLMSLKHASVAKPLSNKVLLFFGKYSYGMYIFNSIFFHVSNWAGVDRMPDNQKLIAYFCVFLLTIVVSFFSYELFESKFLNLKDKITKSTKALMITDLSK
jgi:peptidoglycan/LPS O-acetylase OafA/YrhL